MTATELLKRRHGRCPLSGLALPGCLV